MHRSLRVWQHGLKRFDQFVNLPNSSPNRSQNILGRDDGFSETLLFRDQFAIVHLSGLTYFIWPRPPPRKF